MVFEDPIELMYRICGMEIQWKGFWTLISTLFLFQRIAKPPYIPIPDLEAISHGKDEVVCHNRFVHFQLSLHSCTDIICIPPSCIGCTFQQYILSIFNIADVLFYCTDMLEF